MKLLFLFLTLISLKSFALTSEVVAKIGKDVVTSRKVIADAILEGYWTKDAGGPKGVNIQSDDFNNELNRYLMERVVYLESRSFSLINVSDSEIEKTKKAVTNRIKTSSSTNLWGNLSLNTEELNELIKQKIASQKFIDFKSKASYVPVTEAEAFNYYNNNKAKYEDKDYKSIKESLKKSLAKMQAEQRLEDWYDILKKKYDVTKTITYVTPE